MQKVTYDEMSKAIAVYGISNNAGLAILNIEYGIEDYIIYADQLDYKHRVKIYCGTDRPYFLYGRRRVYLDECMTL